MKKIQSIAFLLLLTMTAMAGGKLSKYDLNRPFGWVTCDSLNDTTCKHKVVGGGNGNKITLVSDGQDMRQRIIDAINTYDVIVFDGKGGDFIVSESMYFKGIKNKTIVGINDARICTQFVMTPEIHQMLIEKGVMERSTNADGTIFTLSNGEKVKEEREWAVRQALIDYTNSQSEIFRRSGLFLVSNISDIVIRNLTLVGPGSVDVGGDDLITISNSCKNVWIDHVDFVDGLDGNCDVNKHSDCITFSWCKFRYTDRSFDHANTNLVGTNDNGDYNGFDELNITYAFCNWGNACNQRMPMVRFGTIHLLNDLYTCPDCFCTVNPRKDSEVLIEGCYFDKGVKRIFAARDAKSYNFRNNIFVEPFKVPADLGKVNINYKYTAMPTKKVLKEVSKYAGATLQDPLKF